MAFEFENGNRNNNILKLSFLDMKHDFKSMYTTDIPVTSRTGDRRGQYSYFKHYFTNIVRLSLPWPSPEFSHIFGGCDRGYGSPEDAGLRAAVNAMGLKGDQRGPNIYKLNYPTTNETDENIKSHYDNIAGILKDYKKGDYIPLVVDYQYLIQRNRGYLMTKFRICRNKEFCADPSKTCVRDFGGLIIDEVGSEPRTYNFETDGIVCNGDVTVSGTIDEVTIQYGNLGLTETYRPTNKVYANDINTCKTTAKLLANSKAKVYVGGEVINSCESFARNAEPGEAFKSTYPEESDIKLVAAQFIKKRLGDQLQVASCKKTINYSNRNTYGSPGKPCVFWSHDRLAVAFAILLGIPAVLELNGGHVHIFLPKVPPVSTRGGGGKQLQKGGVCTRGNLQTIIEGIQSSSEPLVTFLNNTNCQNIYIQNLLEYDSLLYSPENILQIAYYKKIFNTNIENTKLKLTKNLLGVYTAEEEPKEFTEDKYLIYKSRQDTIHYKIDERVTIYTTSSGEKFKSTDINDDLLNALLYKPEDRELESETSILRMCLNGLIPVAILVSSMAIYGFMGGGSKIKSKSKTKSKTKSKPNPSYTDLLQQIAVHKTSGGYEKHIINLAIGLLHALLYAAQDTEFKSCIFQDTGSQHIQFHPEMGMLYGGYVNPELYFFLNNLFVYILSLDSGDHIHYARALIFMPNILNEFKETYLLESIVNFYNTFSEFNLYFAENDAYKKLDEAAREGAIEIMRNIVKSSKENVEEYRKGLTIKLAETNKIYSYLNEKAPFNTFYTLYDKIGARLREMIKGYIASLQLKMRGSRGQTHRKGNSARQTRKMRNAPLPRNQRIRV